MFLDVLFLRSFFEIFRVNCTLRNVALDVDKSIFLSLDSSRNIFDNGSARNQSFAMQYFA